MNKKYRHGIVAHIINLIFYGAFTAWGWWFVTNHMPTMLSENDLFGILLLLAIPIVGISMFVNNLVQQFTINDEGLRERSFTWKTAPMKWSEIKSITVGFNSKLADLLFTPIFYPITISTVKGKATRDSLFGSNREIVITRGIKNRRELIQIIVDKCKDNPDVIIDTKVSSLLNR